MNEKLTVNDIKKALKDCIKYNGSCFECPSYEFCDKNDSETVMEMVLDYFNRLEAENERLKPFEDKIAEFNSHIRVEDMLVFASSLEEWLEFCENLKAEAYKECFEKIKSYYKETRFAYEADNLIKEIEDLLKEKLNYVR